MGVMFRWIQNPQSVSPVFSSGRSVAFFQLVLLDPTDGVWSELQICYGKLPRLSLCVPPLRKKTQLYCGGSSNCSELFSDMLRLKMWAQSHGCLFCGAVASTSCFSVRLGEGPQKGIWVLGSVCCLTTYSSFPTEIWWCVGFSGLCKTLK